MTSLYTEADRKHLALGAVGKFVAANETVTSIPSPNHEVRRQSEKRNENNGKVWKWCGREETQLRALSF